MTVIVPVLVTFVAPEVLPKLMPVAWTLHPAVTVSDTGNVVVTVAARRLITGVIRVASAKPANTA